MNVDERLALINAFNAIFPPSEAAKSAAQRLLEFGQCARPILFYSAIPEHPVFCGGSCFLAKLQGRILVFTAQHCLQGPHRTVEPPLIFTQRRELLPLKNELHLERFRIHEPDDNLWTDLSCWTTDHSPILNGLLPCEYIDLDDCMTRKINVKIGDLCSVFGWPHELAAYTDAGQIEREPTALVCSYGGRDTSKHCHVLEGLIDLINTPNGMSGSPVGVPRLNNGQLVGCDLIGMVVQAGGSPLRVLFVGLEVIIHAALSALRKDAELDQSDEMP